MPRQSDAGAPEPTVWEHVLALGPRVNHGDVTSSTVFVVSEPARVSLRWHVLQVVGNVERYNIYRSTSAGSLGTKIGEAKARAYTDDTVVVGKRYDETGEVYYYSVVPEVGGKEAPVSGPDHQVQVVVPPANMVLVHRWIANQEVCGLMARTVDPARNYSCDYTGPANLSDRYDLGGHLLVDRYEAGGGTPAVVNAPGQTAWQNITTLDAQGQVCAATDNSVKIGGRYHPKHLLSRRMQIAATAWDPVHVSALNTTVDQLEGGVGAGACNTASTAALPTGAAATKNCVTRYGAQDMVGNVWEWTSDQIQNLVGQPGIAGNSDFAGIDFTAQALFTANGSYADAVKVQVPLGLPVQGSSTLDGLVAGLNVHGDYFQINGDTTLRVGMFGGAYDVTTAAGRWQLHLRHHTACMHENIGFRCALLIPDGAL